MEPLIEKGFLDNEDHPEVKQLIKIVNRLNASRVDADNELALCIATALISYDDQSICQLSRVINKFGEDRIAQLESLLN